MVFAAYRDYKRWREAWQQEVREEGRKEGRDAERKRIKQELQKQGISSAEIELILSGESDVDRS